MKTNNAPIKKLPMKDPDQCMLLLNAAYEAADQSPEAEIWEMFSGEFNRHVRSMIPRSRTERKRKFKLLFSLWSSYNRLLQLSEDNPLLVLKRQTEIRFVQDILQTYEGS